MKQIEELGLEVCLKSYQLGVKKGHTDKNALQDPMRLWREIGEDCRDQYREIAKAVKARAKRLGFSNRRRSVDRPAPSPTPSSRRQTGSSPASSTSTRELPADRPDALSYKHESTDCTANSGDMPEAEKGFREFRAMIARAQQRAASSTIRAYDPTLGLLL